MLPDTCETCNGTLSLDLDGNGCPRCLSVPVDDALQAFAREWLGRMVGGHLWSGTFDWRHNEWMLGQTDVVPLYLPAGMDLGVRWLASRHLFTDTDAPRFRSLRALLDGPVMWSLSVWHDDPDRARCVFFAADGHKAVRQHAGDHRPSVTIPALATIPDDAPPRLRAARALALCIEATNP